MIYTAADRDRLRGELVAAARADPRITGAAVTGSASAGREDRWSDIDLAFGVADPAALPGTLADWTDRMYGRHGAVHHVDLVSGGTTYRVFLLPDTLQVDLAFSPGTEFGARAPTFRLLFGDAVEGIREAPAPAAAHLIGWGWLYALHARSCIRRGRLWQAEHMVSGVRDTALTLACLRHGLPLSHGRGFDSLPAELLASLEGSFVHPLGAGTLSRACRVVIDGLRAEIRTVAPALGARLDATLATLASSADTEAT